MLSHFYDKARHQLEDLDSSSWNRYGALLIIIVLIVALALEISRLLSTLNYQPEVRTAIQPTASSSASSNYQASQITNSHLFGRSTTSNLIDRANLQETRLQLILRGAFTSSNPKQASAIIEGPDGQTRSYKSGSRIYGQARLQAVYSDKVVLSRNGQLETLYFPQPGTQSNNNSQNNSARDFSSTVPDSVKQLVQEQMSTEEIQQSSQQLRSSAMTPEQRQALIRQRLQELRERSRVNK